MAEAGETGDAAFMQASRLHAARRLGEAQAVLDRLLADYPAHAPALNLLGIVRGQRGDPAAGVGFVERAVALAPGHIPYLRNLCELHRLAGNPEAGAAAGRRATDSEAGQKDLEAWLNRAMAEHDALALRDAEASTSKAIALDPGNARARFLRAQLALVQGDLASGWRDYGWRWGLPGAANPGDALGLPRWDGAACNGTLALVADQGFGDMIQFARYIPWAAARATALVICIPRELRRLLLPLCPKAKWVEAVSDIGNAVAQIAFSGLPAVAATTLATIPAAPYLAADSAAIATWRRRLDELAPVGARVGLVWAGSAAHLGDRHRSMRLAACGALLDQRGITFIALQKGAEAGQVGGYFGAAPMVNLGPELVDFADTAAVLACLDTTITVDTAVAHLAGALGCGAHVMLPRRPDWRWLLERPDSPWYPSLQLWRDTAEDRRAGTIAVLAAQLREVGALP